MLHVQNVSPSDLATWDHDSLWVYMVENYGREESQDLVHELLDQIEDLKRTVATWNRKWSKEEGLFVE